MPVAVTEILVDEVSQDSARSCRSRERQAFPQGLVGGDDRGTVIDEKRDVALEPNGVAEVIAGWKKRTVPPRPLRLHQWLC